MKQPTSPSVIRLDERRRVRRAAVFLAATMSTSTLEIVARTGSGFPYTRYLPELDLDLWVARSPSPAADEMLSWARSRGKSLMLLRLRDAAEEIADGTVHLVLLDGGAVFLAGYSLYTPDRRNWWLVDRGGPILLRLTPEGPVPTLRAPFADEVERERGVARAGRAFARFVWGT